jgi:hypothetical protein
MAELIGKVNVSTGTGSARKGKGFMDRLEETEAQSYDFHSSLAYRHKDLRRSDVYTALKPAIQECHWVNIHLVCPLRVYTGVLYLAV